MEVFNTITAVLIVGYVYGKLFGIFDLLAWLQIFRTRK